MTIEITVVCGVLVVLIAGVIAVMAQGNRALKRAERELQIQQLTLKNANREQQLHQMMMGDLSRRRKPPGPYKPGDHRWMQRRGPDV